MLLNVNQFEIWLANLNPSKGNEPGKVRPVVIVQSNLLNGKNYTTIVCPISSNIILDVNILRINLDTNQLDKPSSILIDQIRSVDNQRLISKIGALNQYQADLFRQNIGIILDL
jgi:mRNA interferase MazF